MREARYGLQSLGLHCSPRLRLHDERGKRSAFVALDRRIYWSDGILPPRAFAPRLDVVLDVPESERPDSASGRIRFFPDGTATPARLILRAGKLETALAVEWLTGEIRTGAP